MKQALIFILSLLPVSLFAQVEQKDTVTVTDVPESSVIHLPQMPENGSGTAVYNYSPNTTENPLHMDYSPIHITGFRTYPGIAPIASWSAGGIYASGSRQEMPGLMNMDSGAINLWQQFGNLTFEAYGDATKYGYFRGLATHWSYGGSITYKISDNLSLTGFGIYSTASGGFSPAMSGYIGTTNFGGYFDFGFSSKFGVKVGAQTYHSIVENRWRTQPMVMPYFKLGGSDIGIDVGGILYNILVNANGGYRSNPTIAPPKFGDMH